jgi:hypothetical protein
MAFHYLVESYPQKLPNLEQIREFLSRYGKRKEKVRRGFTNPVSGIHCGTNYRVLRNWVTQELKIGDTDECVRGFCDSFTSGHPKIDWKPANGRYKYEFVFHEALIRDNQDDQRVVGCSFHPEGFFKKK